MGTSIPSTMMQSNYSKLKHTYLSNITKNVPSKVGSIQKSIDELVPEELEKKKKTQLNESTYYNTKGKNGQDAGKEFMAL